MNLNLLRCVPCLAVFSFAAMAFGQQEMAGRRIPGAPPRDAGVYHVASATWTRKAAGAAIGGDIIYNNTCSTGYYFSPLSSDTYVTQGRVPSPTSPNTTMSKPGCATSYTVDGFEIAYCTDQTNLGTYSVRFYTSLVACSSVIGVTPTAAFDLTGLPSAPVTGVLTCWAVTIDLATPPSLPPLAFTLLADGDGTYTGTSNNNLFGWAMSNSTAPGHLGSTGPMIAGNPNVCTKFDGTRWDPVVNYAEHGTGMGSIGAFRIEGGPTAPGCYFFDSPWPDFHLKLYADACSDSSLTGISYCVGDGSGTACPCGNASTPAQQAGCRHSFGLAARVRASGLAQIANDSVSLRASECPPSSTALFFQGTLRIANGAGALFGDGLRCAGGIVVRLGVKANDASGSSTYPEPSDPSVSVRGQVGSPGVRDYQVWYRNSAAFCTSAVFNLTNGWEITWTP